VLTGLVSVTFRKLQPDVIVRLVKEAGLDGIEWGGDIHCPPDDLDSAYSIARLMNENNLSTISYGSYYRAGGAKGGHSFDNILKTAVILKTNNIRIWAGDVSSIDASADTWNSVVEDTQRIADIASAHGISISYEYHGGTLTDNLLSTISLLQDADKDNVFTYWQPPDGLSVNDNLNALRQLVEMNKLKNLHVFAWKDTERLPLGDYANVWSEYIRSVEPANPALLLEFVKDDDPGQFIEDAKVLKTIVKG